MIDSIKHNAEMSRLAYKASQHATIDRRFQDDLWPWRQALQAIKDIGGPDCHDMNEQGVLEHFKSLSGKNLAGTIRRYLVREFHQRLRGVRLWLRFEDSEPPRLMAQCDDLLAVFYWMLARDEESARAPLVCASCKRFFLSQRKGAIYCDSSACKEQGRRKLDWNRNKDKYNRNRRRKRRRLASRCAK